MSQKVLVTGAMGFIGRNAARLFKDQGFEVIGLGLGNSEGFMEYGLSEYHQLEISLDNLRKSVGRPDLIIHCAGGASVGFSLDQPREDFTMTVDATSQVLEFIRSDSPSSKLVYLSSAAVYGHAEKLPISEQAPLKPVSPYGVHKKSAEDLCRLYAEQYGVLISIVRFFSIYGEGLQKQLLWDACHKMSQGDFTFFGTGEEIRDWLHVKDAVNLLLVASKKASRDCPVFNGASGKGIRVKEILGYLADALGYIEKPGFSSKRKSGDPAVYIADIQRALGSGWCPMTELKAGVKAYAAWFEQCL
ncbi:MAG: NAD-dependent epimerase/dehydratase family protein [Deltaproteobacteria bacterium]|nr:NAD-dependent epimerase/dehydratase family protein [Deltaproteobacteria bacterium]